MQKRFQIIGLLLVCQILSFFPIFAQKSDFVFVEAESFTEKGGWVLDQQFMDQMGSPFLLAHGIGKPVKNASTEVMLPKKGIWYVYARTWNWCSPWKTNEAPGRFKIAVNNNVLNNELGTGKQWDWEYAGSIDIKEKKVNVVLKDLTGFEGRCDAIVFTRNKDAVIPNQKDDLRKFRNRLLGIPKRPGDAGEYDLVVVGAGTAGLCTAIKGAQEGLKVALINNRPVPGGNNSAEIRVVASGDMNVPPFSALGNTMKLIRNVYTKEEKVIDLIHAEKNISYFPNMHVFAVRKEGKQIG